MSKRIITISREFGSGGRTIGKKVADRVGQVTVLAELAALQVPAELTGEIRSTRHKYGRARDRSLFSQSDKSRRTRADALHWGRSAVKFLYINTGRQIFRHTFSIPKARNKRAAASGIFSTPFSYLKSCV